MKHIKSVTAFCLAASMALQIPVYAQIPDGYDEETWERLNDNRLEYDEIEDIIVNFSPTYIAAQQQMESAMNYSAYEQAAVDMRTAADDMLVDLKQNLKNMEGYPAPSDPDDKEDYQLAVGSLIGAIEGTRGGAKQLEKAVENMKKAIDRSLGTSVKGSLVTATESLMMSYYRLVYANELMDASVELSQAAYNSAVTQQNIGMGTADDVVAAQESLVSAKAQQEGFRYQLNQVKQNLCLLTGWEYNADIEIGAIPEPDQDRIAGMNPETDVEKAIGNNYTLSSTRRSGSSGMTAAQKQSRLRKMEEMEDQIKIQVNQAYQNVIQKQTAYQAASAAYSSANTTYAGSQRQYQLGMVSSLQFQQLKVGYLSQKMNYENAKLDFFQAMEDYDWAIKGNLSLE